MTHTVVIRTPEGETKIGAYARYADAQAAYKKQTRAREDGAASVIWLHDGRLYRRYRIDLEMPNGQRREMKYNLYPQAGGRKIMREGGERRLGLRVPGTVYAALETTAKEKATSINAVAVDKLGELQTIPT